MIDRKDLDVEMIAKTDFTPKNLLLRCLLGLAGKIVSK